MPRLFSHNSQNVYAANLGCKPFELLNFGGFWRADLIRFFLFFHVHHMKAVAVHRLVYQSRFQVRELRALLRR